MLPKVEFDSGSSARAAKIAQLEEQIAGMQAYMLEHIKGIARNFNSDPRLSSSPSGSSYSWTSATSCSRYEPRWLPVRSR